MRSVSPLLRRLCPNPAFTLTAVIPMRRARVGCSNKTCCPWLASRCFGTACNKPSKLGRGPRMHHHRHRAA